MEEHQLPLGHVPRKPSYSSPLSLFLLLLPDHLATVSPSPFRFLPYQLLSLVIRKFAENQRHAREHEIFIPFRVLFFACARIRFCFIATAVVCYIDQNDTRLITHACSGGSKGVDVSNTCHGFGELEARALHSYFLYP